MKVFVSHSMKDQSILDGISKALNPHGIELLIAEHKVDMKKTITGKIEEMINTCHVGLILMTKNGLISGFVREEIGFLEARKKPCLIIFEKGIEKEYCGFKYGNDYVELDTNNPEIAVDRVKKVLLTYWNNLVEKQNQISKKKEAFQKEQNSALIGLGILAGFLILVFSD